MLLSLITKLAFATQAVPAGRLFIRHLITLSTKAKMLHHHLHFNSDAQVDIAWWQEFSQRGMASTNGWPTTHRCSRPRAKQRRFWHTWMWCILSRGVVSPQLATTSSATCVYPIARTLPNCCCSPHLGPHLAAKACQILLWQLRDCQLIGRQIFQASSYHALGAHAFSNCG